MVSFADQSREWYSPATASKVPLWMSEPPYLASSVVSASRDGQYIADLAGQMGVRSIRGSSRKKGYSALHGVLSEIKAGNYVCFTPDGRAVLFTSDREGKPCVYMAPIGDLADARG